LRNPVDRHLLIAKPAFTSADALIPGGMGAGKLFPAADSPNAAMKLLPFGRRHA
jgi:hypothetical protein